MRFKREISDKIQQLAGIFPVTILTGARQTGKTTLLRDIFAEFNYVSLDLPSQAEQAENDPATFLQQNPPPLVIDEAQYAPGLFRHLKVAVDGKRDQPGQYVLTGSQKLNLMKEVSDSLAGRCVWLELEGLSVMELIAGNSLDAHNTNELLRLFVRGSLPELWQRPEIPSTEYYRTYLATYLERDVRQIVNVASLRDFERFIRVCATRNGQLLNKTDIASDVGITVNTVNKWLSVLEASNQIQLLEPYFGNTGKRVIKSPKLYFSEPGLLAYLLGLNDDNISRSPFLGTLWETLLSAEFRKTLKNTDKEGHLWFYRDNQAREVDFILDSGNKLDFFEAKWTGKPDKKADDSMRQVYDDMARKNQGKLIALGDKYIVCRTDRPYKSESGTNITNLSYFTEHS